MSAPVKYPVEDLRTAEELADYNHAMPTVTLSMKRLLEHQDCKEFARVLPSISDLYGINTIGLHDIVYIGGGALLDKATHAEKCLEELCGRSRSAGVDANKDFNLHRNFLKWRQLLITVHQRAKIHMEQEAKQDLREEQAETEPLNAYERKWGFRPDPHEYSGGTFAKAIDQQGLSYLNDDKTDWRRAAPASGRLSNMEKDKKAAPRQPLNTGADALNAFSRKQITILLLHGLADISTAGFDCGGFGKSGGER